MSLCGQLRRRRRRRLRLRCLRCWRCLRGARRLRCLRRGRCCHGLRRRWSRLDWELLHGRGRGVAIEHVDHREAVLRYVEAQLVSAPQIAYPGPLLGDDEAAWVAKPRDALRTRFVRAVMELGAALERAGDWATAIDVYRRGLEADNLAESFYRGLMRALAATGDHAEALNTFRRCRDLLSIVLGVKPAADTDRLYRDIVGRTNR